MSVFSDFQSSARRLGAPVCVGLVIAMILTFLVQAFTASQFPTSDFVFNTAFGFSKPWTLLTYPFVTVGSASNGLLGLVFASLWLWGIGSALEREMKSIRFAIAWVAFSVMSALFLFAGAKIFDIAAPLYGAWSVLATITVMWGTRNPDQTVMLMFIIPIKGKWLAWLAGLLAFFGTVLQLGVFAALPCIVAYFFAADKLPIRFAGGSSRSSKKGSASVRGAGMYSKEYFEEVQKREKEREEKERLRKLFERSLIEDPDTKDADG